MKHQYRLIDIRYPISDIRKPIPVLEAFPWCASYSKSLHGYKIEAAIYMYIYQERCALNPPPCFWFWWWQTSGGTQKSIKKESKTTARNVMADKWANAKSNQKSIQKPQKIIKNKVWDHPGGSRGGLGDHFGPRTAQGSKRGPNRREKVHRFWHQNGDPVQLSVAFSFRVF